MLDQEHPNHPDGDRSDDPAHPVAASGPFDIDLAATNPFDEDIAPEMLELEKIPRRLWEQTLAPLHPQLRFFAARRIPDARLQERAIELAMELNASDRAARRARQEARGRGRRTAAPLPSPEAAHPAIQPTIQIGLRLRRDDYARLKEAAAAVGLKPTTLARALVLNGASKVLADRGAT